MRVAVASIVFLLGVGLADGQDVRRRTRPTAPKLTEQQATDVTLTMSVASVRPIQVWVRMAGTLDATSRLLRGHLAASSAAQIAVGQRVRAFSPDSKSSMTQARVSRVTKQPGGVEIEATLSAQRLTGDRLYVMEIVVEAGEYLSVPNEALIEEGMHEGQSRQVVYTERSAGQYEPVAIATGLQGELYTQVVSGLKEGDRVVTYGSFFIDAEYKLKGIAVAPAEAIKQ